MMSAPGRKCGICFRQREQSNPRWLPGKNKRAPNLRITLIGTNQQPKRRPIVFSLSGEVNRKDFFIFGFSRQGTHPLDASPVHPESYSIVDRMAADRGCTVRDLMRDDSLRKGIRLDQYITDAIGLPTLTDIINELAKPGRDPREQFEIFAFTEGVSKLEDLKPG